MPRAEAYDGHGCGIGAGAADGRASRAVHVQAAAHGARVIGLSRRGCRSYLDLTFVRRIQRFAFDTLDTLDALRLLVAARDGVRVAARYVEVPDVQVITGL
jgi:hypothetical protein